jgi:two-component system chemotaxis response regulator CheV
MYLKPVINLPKWMGFEMNSEEIDRSIIIVSDFSHNFVGLRVSHIHGVEEKDWKDIHPASNYSLNVNTNQIINHTYLDDSETLCFILDIEKLLIEAMPAMASKIFASAKNIEQGFELSERLKAKTILFAEDSKSIQKYMSMVFEQLGLAYKCFDNGRLLLDYVAQFDSKETLSKEVSMIFTDLEMPVASGHTVIKELRAQTISKEIPIIIHTSMTSENNSREVIELGADYFIGKVDTQLILETIQHLQEDGKV